MNSTNLSDKRFSLLLPVILVVVILAAATTCGQKKDCYQRDSGMIFGTMYSIIYQSDESLRDDIILTLKEVDNSLSMFNKESVISKVNGNSPVCLDSNFLRVMDIAFEVNRETFGAFDITVAPLVNAWGFGFKNGEMPTDAKVDSLRQIIGMEKIRLEDSASGKRIVKSDSRVMLDCSAIAKGYGVEAVADMLRSKGIRNFMVEIGGEIVTSGINEKRLPWKIGVVKPTDDPTNTKNELQTCLNLTDKAMATSGNYRNFYYKGGKKYAHTIDPKTGYPVQHNILSSTVITDNCAIADAYATAFMVLGLDKARQVIDRHPELLVYFIYSNEDGKMDVWFSPGLRDKIEK